jgi:hypothetical protein
VDKVYFPPRLCAVWVYGGVRPLHCEFGKPPEQRQMLKRGLSSEEYWIRMASASYKNIEDQSDHHGLYSN